MEKQNENVIHFISQTQNLWWERPNYIKLHFKKRFFDAMASISVFSFFKFKRTFSPANKRFIKNSVHFKANGNKIKENVIIFQFYSNSIYFLTLFLFNILKRMSEEKLIFLFCFLFEKTIKLIEKHLILLHKSHTIIDYF